jgi:hypothetical protein
MLTGVGGRARARGPAGARRRRGPAAAGSPPRRGLGWALALALALAALFLLALGQSRTVAANSDGAATVLQAQAMLHGNPLLSGWWTSDVSFFTTELPEYALVMAVRGASPNVVHICGALTYTLTLALAALLARGSAAGPAGLRRAGLTVAIMLAPSILGGTDVFLENPDHFGTSAPILLLLLLLDWGYRPARRQRRATRWCVPAAACVLLAWTQVGDELSLAAATVPLAAVCACRLVADAGRHHPAGRSRSARPGAGLPAGRREDGPLLAAALASVGIARLAQQAITALGGFDQRAIPGGRLAPLRQLPANAHVLWQSIVLLFGVNRPGAPSRAITRSQHLPLLLMTDLHVIGLVLAGVGLVAGIAAAFAGRLGPAGRVTQILVAAIGATVAAGLFGSVLKSLSSAHEVAVLLPLAAVLAGRTLPPLLPDRRRAAQVATAALAVWLALGVAEMGDAARWPAKAMPVQTVADWLIAHHEHEGLASYWQGAATTVTTGGRVLVAPVTGLADTPGRWNASSRWYRPDLHRATFVIAEVHPPQPEDSLAVAVVRARFGPPAAEYHVGADIIMTYDYNLLTRVRGAAFPGPS